MMEERTETISSETSAAIALYEEAKEKAEMVKRINHVPWKKDLKKNWIIYVLFLIPFAWLLVFHYIPMFGIILAFKDYNVWLGIWGSPWVGWYNFQMMFTGGGSGAGQFLQALRNTLVIGGLNLTVGFLPATIFALIITQVRFKRFKRVCQMLSYLPNFVSGVVIVQLMQNLLADNGAITAFMHNVFGLPLLDWTQQNSPWFWVWYIVFGIWQSFGFGSIMMVSSISNIDGDLFEAASIDGAGRWQMMWKITLPCILPMFLMMWLLQVGLIFKVGYDRTQLLYNPTSNAEVCDTLFSYTMRNTMNNNLGVSTASSLFQSVVGTVLMLLGNWLSRKAAGFSMF